MCRGWDTKKSGCSVAELNLPVIKLVLCWEEMFREINDKLIKEGEIIFEKRR